MGANVRARRTNRGWRCGIAIGAIVCSLGALTGTASAWNSDQWQSPSGNLVCKYRASFDALTCAARNQNRVVQMTSTTAAREGSLMRWTGALPVLAYGQNWTTNGRHITCRSAFNGVRCTNYAGHGFFISRSEFNTW